MLTSFELEQRWRALALKAAQPPTPQHSAAAAANQFADHVAATAEAQRRRSRMQHQVDPYPGDDDDCEMDEAAVADLGKRIEAYDTPAGYPPLGPVSPEIFRRGLVRAGHSAPGTDYDPVVLPAAPSPATIRPGMASRPLVTGGPWSCAPDTDGR